MLRRAFWDASELHLEEIVEGKSGAIVCSAHARLDDGWAAPLFLKLGDRKEIIKSIRPINFAWISMCHFISAPAWRIAGVVLDRREGSRRRLCRRVREPS